MNDNAEVKFIAHIVNNEEDMAYAVQKNIDSNIFTYRDPDSGIKLPKIMFLMAREYYFEHNRLLTKDVVESMVGKNKDVDQQQSSNIITFFIMCKTLKVDTNSFPIIVEELSEKKYGRIISDLITKEDGISNIIENEGYEAAYKHLRNEILTVESSSESDDGTEIFNVETDLDKFLENYIDRKNNPEKYRGIKVGLSKIDEQTNGFKPSTFNIIMAESGGGKSMVLLNWAAEIYSKGHNVLFFNFEMDEWQMISRLMARQNLINYDLINNAKLDEYKETRLKQAIENQTMFLDKSMSDNENHFTIISQYNNKTVPSVEGAIKKHIKEKGPVDAIFVDYLGVMEDHYTTQTNGPKWAHAGQCALKLRDLARAYNLTVFTAQQVNREGLKSVRKKIENDAESAMAYSESMSDSKEAVNCADSIIFVNTNIDMGLMYFKKVKARDFSFEPFSARFIPQMCLVQELSHIGGTMDSTISKIYDRDNMDRRIEGHSDVEDTDELDDIKSLLDDYDD